MKLYILDDSQLEQVVGGLAVRAVKAKVQILKVARQSGALKDKAYIYYGAHYVHYAEGGDGSVTSRDTREYIGNISNLLGKSGHPGDSPAPPVY